MALPKRNCVFVALSHTVGHELVFRHVTNKVVVGTYKVSPNEESKPHGKSSRKKP